MYEDFEELCKVRGVTPYRVCKETGIATATISHWKVGSYTPKRDKLQKLADYFGVDVNLFIYGKQSDIPQVNIIKEDVALFEVYSFLNAEDKELVKKLVLRLSGFDALPVNSGE